MRRIWSRIFLVVLCLALLAGNVFAGETTLILRFRPIESGVCAIDSIYGVSANYQNGATIYCSELITRFYQTLYGVDVLVGDGPIVTGDDADTYWFEPTTSPVAGDVAYAAPAKRGKGYPHYALVKYANAKAGTVTLMEQNWSWNGGAAYERTIPYSGDCYVFYSLRCASGKAKMNVPEADTVSPWAKSAVQRADALGVTSGLVGGYRRTITRGVLVRLCVNTAELNGFKVDQTNPYGAACAVAMVLPTHSMTTSTPSIPVSARMRAVRSSWIGSIAAFAPSCKPISRRVCTGSLSSTCDAPDSFASCTISNPIAPPPMTSTVSPVRICARSMPWRQQASGSAMAPYSSGSSGSSRKHCASGA